MEQLGIVAEVTAGKAKVRIDRESACGGHCVSCKGCPSEAILIEVEAPAGIRPGDQVLLEMENRRFLYSSLIGYGLLALLVLAGAVSCYAVFHSELLSVLGAAAGLAAGLLLLRLIYGKRRQHITIKKKEDLEV